MAVRSPDAFTPSKLFSYPEELEDTGDKAVTPVAADTAAPAPAANPANLPCSGSLDESSFVSIPEPPSGMRTPSSNKSHARSSTPSPHKMGSPPLQRSNLARRGNCMEQAGTPGQQRPPAFPLSLKAISRARAIQTMAAQMDNGSPDTSATKPNTPQFTIAITPPAPSATATPQIAQPNPEFTQSTGTAIRALQKSPSAATFYYTTTDGKRKQYYQAQFSQVELLQAGRMLAASGGYPPNITARLKNHSKGIAYASITFQKHPNHAQKTYDELCEDWAIQEKQPLLLNAFAGGMVVSSQRISPEEITRLERLRTGMLQDFVNRYYSDGQPKDPAFTFVCSPIPEMRRDLLGHTPAHIAATDYVIFVYKEVPNTTERKT